MTTRYPVSKLLEVLVVRELAAQTGPDYPITINCLNPGFCHSELAREAGWGLYLMKLFLARSTEVGSRAIVTAAIAGPETHGLYMSESIIAEPSLLVQSEEGLRAQKKVWSELLMKLESISLGVTANL